MLRDDVVPPIRGKFISAPNLANAVSVVSRIRNRAISCVRELRRPIDAIDASVHDLVRAARIRADVLRTELHRSWGSRTDRREALTGINHPVAAETSGRHRLKRWTAATACRSATARDVISTAIPMMTASVNRSDQSRTRQERDR